MKSNFGGAMVWTIDMDDYLGTFCNQGKYPLINVLHKALNLDQQCRNLILPDYYLYYANNENWIMYSEIMGY